MHKQKEIIETLKKARATVIISGASCSKKWAEEIGADGYGAEANDTVKLANNLVS